MHITKIRARFDSFSLLEFWLFEADKTYNQFEILKKVLLGPQKNMWLSLLKIFCMSFDKKKNRKNAYCNTFCVFLMPIKIFKFMKQRAMNGRTPTHQS